jgi:glucosamine--fructose-6-phosphate aminotransferase (isomerizing)
LTELLQDILAEPAELAGILDRLLGPRHPELEGAAALLGGARHVYAAGIGSSWHAGMAVCSFFDAAARPAFLAEASELLHFGAIPPDSALLVLSRSGRSVEIVKLVRKAREAGAKIIGVTNTPDSPLARESDVVIPLDARFDHLVSVSMYSGVALAGALVASAALGSLGDATAAALRSALAAADESIDGWRCRIEESEWPRPGAPIYLLARGASLASCHEARLAFEEATKSPASALTTGGYRHGPQESIHEGLRIAFWLDGAKMRGEDLALAEDSRRAGARVMLIGRNIPADAGDLVVNLPAIPPEWQFLIDIIPAQLAAECLARRKGVDCDSFRLCPYIIESEGGLSARS